MIGFGRKEQRFGGGFPSLTGEGYLSPSWLGDAIRGLVREGVPTSTEEDRAAIVQLVFRAIPEEDRLDALLFCLDRYVSDLLRAERQIVLNRIRTHQEHRDVGFDPDDGWRTLDELRDLLALCDRYVVVAGERRRAGGCRSFELRLVAADYRKLAASQIQRAKLFEQLAADMDTRDAETLDDLAELEAA